VVAPRVTVRSNGEFVAVWVAEVATEQVALRSATRSIAGQWTAETVRDSCCDGLEALEGTADGSVTVVARERGGPSSSTMGPGSDLWGPRQPLPASGYDRFSFAPDGSAAGLRLACGDGSDCLEASYRLPGAEGGWSDPESVPGASGVDISGYAVEATPSSGYSVVWGEADSMGGGYDPPGAVRSSDRGPGLDGAWGTPLTVVALPADAPGCADANCFAVAVGPDGAQVAVWQQAGAGGDQMSGALRGSGGPWGAAEDVGDPGSGTAPPVAAITTSGIPVAAWGAFGSGAAVARGSHRVPTGAWDPVTLGTPAAGTVPLDSIATDGDGNALTAWADRNGVFSGAFDGGGPRFSAFSPPAGGSAGQSLAFAAAADDNWSAVAGISWLFGDGAGAPEATTSHTYGAPGAYTATATAIDAAGNATQRSGTVDVGAAPAPTPNPNSCGATDQDRDGVNDGCDDNNGAARPVPFKTVSATVVSGEVFVKLPAGAARASQAKPPKGFVRLEGAETIPVRSILDTSRGRVRLRTASDTRKHVQTADFFRGRFVVRQVRKPRGKARRRSNKLITDIVLNGSSFRRACRTTTASISQKRRRSKKRVRRLFGDGKGTFRTRGRNAAATVRGTRWGVQDRCDGTLVKVQRGRVSVRDLVKRKTVIVRTGEKYLARRR
jgi:hypothetical protein